MINSVDMKYLLCLLLFFSHNFNFYELKLLGYKEYLNPD